MFGRNREIRRGYAQVYDGIIKNVPDIPARKPPNPAYNPYGRGNNTQKRQECQH